VKKYFHRPQLIKSVAFRAVKLSTIFHKAFNGGHKMDSCMIKNCDKEAYEEGMCAQHYIDLLKKVIPETPAGEKTPAGGSDRSEEMPAKAEYLMHSLLVHTEKVTDSLVSSFNNIFNLTKDETADIYRQMGNKFIKKSDNQKAIPLLKKVVRLNPDDADSKYQLGSAYLAKGSYDEAIALFEEAIRLDPGTHEYHFALGVAYEQKELFGEAITSLQKAAELNPDNPDVYYSLGVVFDIKEKYKEAVDSFKKAIELNPKQADYHQSLGFTYESLDQHKEAVKCYKKAMFLKKSSF